MSKFKLVRVFLIIALTSFLFHSCQKSLSSNSKASVEKNELQAWLSLNGKNFSNAEFPYISANGIRKVLTLNWDKINHFTSQSIDYFEVPFEGEEKLPVLMVFQKNDSGTITALVKKTIRCDISESIKEGKPVYDRVDIFDDLEHNQQAVWCFPTGSTKFPVRLYKKKNTSSNVSSQNGINRTTASLLLTCDTYTVPTYDYICEGFPVYGDYNVYCGYYFFGYTSYTLCNDDGSGGDDGSNYTGYYSGGSGTYNGFPYNADPNGILNGPGSKPLGEYPASNRCVGFQDMWNNYTNNETAGFITADGSLIFTQVLPLLGGQINGTYSYTDPGTGITQVYYVYPVSAGAPSQAYPGMISNGTDYYIPIVASIHTHTECRNDGTTGVSNSVGSEDISFSAKRPSLRNWVIGCDAIAQYNSGPDFFNISYGPISGTCGIIQ